MKNVATLSGIAALAVSGASFAAVSGLSVTADEGLIAGTTTYRIFVNFDNDTDNLLAVSGNAAIAALEFSADSMLVQDSGAFDGLAFSDTPNIFDANGADSWVSIGGSWMTGSSDTSFSPDFLGGDGVASVINGSSFTQADNGGYFDSNPGTAETGSVIIAQFTLSNDTTTASYSGTLSYGDGSNTPVDQAFSVTLVPAPGAVALLGLAGLAGTRRRRA